MKNIFKSLMLVAVAAMGFACQETMEENYTPTNPREVVMTIIADMDEETRTYISDEANGKIAWSEGDQLKVIENSAVYRTSDAATIDADGKAQFAVSFPKNSGAVAYNAVFPASAVVEEAEVNANEVQVAVKNFQYPAEDSFDPQADILVAKQLEFDAQPTELNMQFKRLVALGKMTLKGIADDAEISKVVFTVENKGLAGRNTVNTTTGEVVSYGDVNTITLTYAEPIDTRDIYFTCNPFKLVADDTFKVTVICADKTAYIREVKLAGNKELTFTEGDMSTFSVAMEKVSTQTVSSWNLVKDVNDLAVGDQIIIAAKDSNVAMSTTQNKNNRGQADVTKNGDTLGTPSASVQILTLQEGTVDGTFAFYTGSGYLYAASSSSNYLKTQTTNNNNSSWSIIVNTTDATVKVVAQGTYTRNTMMYNETSSLFACYASSSSQQAIVIYKYTETVSGGDIEILPEPSFSVDVESIEFAAEGGEETIAVTPENNFYGAVTATTDAEWLTIENDDYTFTITAGANEGNGRSAVVTFSAQDCDDVEVTVSQAANFDNIEELTVAEFIAKDVNDNVYYKLTGTITSVVNTTYGNFDLTDDTGTIYVYGLNSLDGATNQYWNDSGAKLGDDIVIYTTRSVFNNTAQGGNARFVELLPGSRAFWSFSADKVVFGSSAQTQEIEISAFNLTAEIDVRSNNDQFTGKYASGVLTISAKENTTADSITGVISVTSGTLTQEITVQQNGVSLGTETVTASAVMKDLGYANAAKVETINLDDNVTVTFDKAKSSNDPAYYTSGNAVRLYQNGATMTVTAGGKTIQSIEITFANNHYYIAPDAGEWSDEAATRTWEGEATQVLFTTTGTDKNHRAYISAITVTYLK